VDEAAGSSDSAAVRLDRGAALLVIGVDLHGLPNGVREVGVAACECIDSVTILGVNDKDTAHWSFAVVGHQSAGRDHIYVISLGLIEMDAVSAVKFGARANSVSAVKGMDHEQHWLCPMVRSIMSPLNTALRLATMFMTA